MPYDTTETATITIRLTKPVIAAINAAKPWRKSGHTSRSEWLRHLISEALDLRTVPKGARFEKRKSYVYSRRGQI